MAHIEAKTSPVLSCFQKQSSQTSFEPCSPNDVSLSHNPKKFTLAIVQAGDRILLGKKKRG